MAFSSNSNSGGPMADINVTPLVDVMLVLLIIFMITAPLMQNKVKVELPKATLEKPVELKTPPITVAIRENGELYWNDEKMTPALFEQNLALTAQKEPQPQVNVRADKTTKYGIIDDAVQLIRDKGIKKVGFVSTPER